VDEKPRHHRWARTDQWAQTALGHDLACISAGAPARFHRSLVIHRPFARITVWLSVNPEIITVKTWADFDLQHETEALDDAVSIIESVRATLGNPSLDRGLYTGRISISEVWERTHDAGAGPAA
jgi:hypothetical protein